MTAAPPELTDPRRKRLFFRCLHRGTHEADLLIGGFARETLAAMSDAEVDRFEALLEEPDLDILGWIMGDRPIPPEHDNDIMSRLKNYRYSVD